MEIDIPPPIFWFRGLWLGLRICISSQVMLRLLGCGDYPWSDAKVGDNHWTPLCNHASCRGHPPRHSPTFRPAICSVSCSPATLASTCSLGTLYRLPPQDFCTRLSFCLQCVYPSMSPSPTLCHPSTCPDSASAVRQPSSSPLPAAALTVLITLENTS